MNLLKLLKFFNNNEVLYIFIFDEKDDDIFMLY